MMELVLMKRGQGKTNELIEWAAEPETADEMRYLVVRDQATARMVHRQAEVQGKNIRFPMTYREAVEHRTVARNPWRMVLGVDDLEAFVQSMFIYEVAVASMNMDKVQIEGPTVLTSTIKSIKVSAHP